MTPSPQSTPTLLNPRLDLQFERIIAAPRAGVWRAYTEPALLKRWFCPLPWTTTDCEIDLRPGGVFRTTMRSPEGQLFPNAGCYLDIVPGQRLVWTNALLADFRPSEPSVTCGHDSAAFMFTARVELADHPAGTRYTATVMHADEAGCRAHAALGFEAGWSAALDQLVALVAKGL